MHSEWRLGEPATLELASRLRVLARDEQRKVGFPGWSAPFPGELLPFFSHELNQYGDPMLDPVFPWHVKDLEREVVTVLADLFGAPAQDRWGYVTSGSSEAILYGLWLGRTLHPEASVYCSRAAHPCVPKNAQLLDRTVVQVATDARGEMDYENLCQKLAADRERGAIVVATIGTTFSEAVDDVGRIRQALRRAGVTRYFIHADGALSAIPLAVSLSERLPFGLHAEGVDSLSVSGHKFLAAPFPCGVVITRASHRQQLVMATDYTGSCAATVSSSRNGHATLLLWHRLRSLGTTGLRRLARQSRELAEYARKLLTEAGWDAWRAQPYACTVVLETPPLAVLARWPMATQGRSSHLVCTPGVEPERIARFVDEVRTHSARRERRELELRHDASLPPARLARQAP